jgi:hypothetical protein
MGKFSSGSSDLPNVTPRMTSSVSQYRRGTLESEYQKGLYRQGSEVFSQASDKSYLANIAKGIRKTASFTDGSTNGGWGGAGGSVRQMGEVYSPLWLYSHLNLPRDRATINAWSRAYFALNPMVHNAISLHSTYPIAKLSIKCKNKKVENFFATQIEELDLMNVISQIAQEYWLTGEAIPYAELNQSTGKWRRIIIQNPDYVLIQHNVMGGEPLISLRPDESLKRLIKSNKASDNIQKQKLDPRIIEYVNKNENIPLDNFGCSHLARRISPYEVRGTGLIVPAFKALMLFDLFRESKYVQATSFVNPLTLVKIGSAEYKPTPQDILEYRDIFEQAEADRNFKIFTHQDVTVERVGASGGIYDIGPDITQLIKEIYIALMVPSVIMDGGSDTTYTNGTVALDVLRQRYMQFRNMLTNWLRRKIFAPISMINDFYEYEGGEKYLIVPEIDWNHMSMFDMGDYISTIMQLSTAEKKGASMHTLYRSLGLDWEDEQRRIKLESIDEAIHAKEKINLEKIPLNELRALGVNNEIPDIPDVPLPGESAYDAGGAGAAGGDMMAPDMGMGLPGVPPPGDAPMDMPSMDAPPPPP